MTQYQDIRYAVRDPVAIITLNRPQQLNAFTHHTLAEIRDAIEQAAADKAVVGVVITGEGRAFSAGLDMAVLEATTRADVVDPTPRAPDAPAGADSADDELPGIFSYLLQVPKPVIAAVNGVTAGGGLILALMSDLRFASETAAFTTVFLKRGLIAEHGSSWLLPRLVGVSRALDLLWMSDKISAAQAAEIGLVDRVLPADELLGFACDYVKRLSTSVAPKAIGETKRLVYRHLGQSYEQALREADASQNAFVTAPDAAEGAQAFIQKRPPKFSRVGD